MSMPLLQRQQGLPSPSSDLPPENGTACKELPELSSAPSLPWPACSSARLFIHKNIDSHCMHPREDQSTEATQALIKHTLTWTEVQNKAHSVSMHACICVNLCGTSKCFESDGAQSEESTCATQLRGPSLNGRKRLAFFSFCSTPVVCESACPLP